MQSQRLHRNIGIAAHVDAGKTSLTEAILHRTGKIHRIGKVHEGNAAMDFDPQEQERGITIKSAATSFAYQGHTFNLIDTPGHDAFTYQVERSLRVLDGAVLLIDAVAGVQPQTEVVFRQARRYGVPMILVVNKMDRPGADYAAALASVEEKLGVHTVSVFEPVGCEADFSGMVAVDHARLADEVAMLDEQLLSIHGSHTDADVEAALVRAVRSGAAVAAMPASAKSGIGIEQVLDMIMRYLPAPEQLVVDGAAEDEVIAFVFNQSVDASFGALSWLRVYAGSVKAGQTLYAGREKVRVAQIGRMHAAKRESVDSASWGDIVAVQGLDKLASGTTLSTSGSVELEGIHAADPLVRVAVESSDRDRLGAALAAICKEDPSLRSSVDADSGQRILAGIGELHIEVVLERIRREWNIDVRSGAPQVAYRVTLARAGRATGRNVSQTGGGGQYAIVDVEAAPGMPGSGIEIIDATSGGSIGRDYMRGVIKGIEDACEASTLDGWPLVDAVFTVVDGKTHAVDSSEMAFRTAGRLACEALQEVCGLVLLEPMTLVDVDAPSEHVGSVVGEIQRRGGQVQLIEGERVVARMPLAACFGWVNALRSLTQGRGVCSLAADGYQQAQPIAA